MPQLAHTFLFSLDTLPLANLILYILLLVNTCSFSSANPIMPFGYTHETLQSIFARISNIEWLGTIILDLCPSTRPLAPSNPSNPLLHLTPLLQVHHKWVHLKDISQVEHIAFFV